MYYIYLQLTDNIRNKKYLPYKLIIKVAPLPKNASPSDPEYTSIGFMC